MTSATSLTSPLDPKRLVAVVTIADVRDSGAGHRRRQTILELHPLDQNARDERSDAVNEMPRLPIPLSPCSPILIVDLAMPAALLAPL